MRNKIVIFVICIFIIGISCLATKACWEPPPPEPCTRCCCENPVTCAACCRCDPMYGSDDPPDCNCPADSGSCKPRCKGCYKCDGNGHCILTCDPDKCESCVNGQCRNYCDDDPNLKCCIGSNAHCCNKNYECCGSGCCNPDDCQTCQDGHCVSKCEPNKCETCNGNGNCIVCNGDPNLTCYNGHCCCAPNGCGPCGGPSVPDNPTGCSDTSFLDACNGHDSCYGGCGNDKSVCDSNFQTAMLIVCGESATPECRPTCVNNAILYYDAVKYLGGSAYQAAQNCSCGY